MRHFAKTWRFECLQCHAITKHWGWDHEPEKFPTRCACGGDLDFERANRRVDGVIPDDIPGGMVMQHVEPGRRVYSRTELKTVLAKHGWRINDQEGWAGPNDRFFTKNAGIVTADDLEKAKKLVERM